MTKYRGILRPKILAISEIAFATRYGVAKNTFARVCKRATELSIQWSLDPKNI